MEKNRKALKMLRNSFGRQSSNLWMKSTVRFCIHYGLIEADEEQEVVEAEENTIAVEDIQDVVI